MASTSISQTQSTFVSSSTPTKYDVFLSFHGEDTRLNFTGHLYNKLHDHGINTFKDDVELRRGEVISDALRDAIRNSKTCIAVLSVNYARSSWCLDELAEILNCYKTMQRLVIPVFYKIDPSVVESQTGSFEQAFEEHQVRFAGEMEKVNNWKLTLKEVAGFSGYHVSEDRSEADVINEIVDELLLKINPKTLHVAKNPVGLDSHVEAITTLLSSDTKGVIKFGIYGMGGVGKTTLAKALFNQLLGGGRFKGSCFLANVRENSGTAKGLVSLQMQLINDVLRSRTKVEVPNVDQGIELIEARICSTKVVVVIDDLDDLEQFQSLVGPFASGSVVIITTRGEDMLEQIKVEQKYRYKLEVLDYAQSRELFTHYAFEKAEPPNNLLALCEVILDLADGLPLALQVFGSHLSTKKEVGWKSYIKTLQQHPNSTIEQKLAISLDALESDDRMLKKMFIDIACFFIGWKKEKAVEVLDTYYSYPDDKMETLTKRCLLTMNKYSKLEMHDLLRDVGRNVARNNAPDEPGKYSRLWLPEDIGNVLKNHKGTIAIEVEGIIPCNLYNQDALEGKSFTTETFKWMNKLRFLYFKKVNLTGSFQQMFEDLRWLCWDCCPLKCLPSDFYPEKLVILELPRSNMRTMWDLNMGSRVFGKLKTLNMSGSKDLSTTPDFTKLPCLETLDLEGCISLETVHVPIGSLGKLVSLNLGGCEKLRTLPDTICNLRSLEILDISRCSSLEALPTAIGNIETLKKINGRGLTVSKLPDSIGNLTKLVELNLRDNMKLETLPDTICNLGSLEKISIFKCENLKKLPDELWKITSLRELDARCTTLLKKLPDIGSSQIALSLQELKLYRSGITALPSGFSQLSNLEILDIAGCEELETLPDELWKITRLRQLDARWTTQLKKLPDIGSSQIALSLQELDLSWSGITALPSGFSQLSNLEYLDLSKCDHLLSIPKLPPNLKWINASGSGITALPSGFSQLSNLDQLYLGECVHLLSIPKLPPNLKQIAAHGCSSLERIPNLSNLKRLEQLDLGGCTGLTEIQGLEELTSITDLGLGGCSGLTEIQGLEKLTSITDLNLGDLSCSLVEYNLTKPLFQVYSEFGHSIKVYVAEKFINEFDWITESPYWTSESTTELTSESTTELTSESSESTTELTSESTTELTTVYAHLLPNESHNFMGIILCFETGEDWCAEDTFGYSVKNTASGFIWSDNYLDVPSSESLMVIVPKSIFSVRDDDHRIELTADSVKILGIHLLYNTETEMIEDVAKKHVIDIDELKLVDPELQAIFLDIACFFIGWKKEEVVHVLETYYPNAERAVDILKEICLLTIDDSDELEMNDLLRNIGRKIARNSSPDEPGRHSRLWLSIDIYDVLKKQKGTKAIEGIIPRKLGYQDALEGESFTTETFKKMSKLRFLYLKNVNLTGSFEQTLEDLRWLCWDECPLECLPSDFYPQKLVILELPHSQLKTMWEPNMVPHVFDKLKTLNMSYSLDLTTTPDFSKLPCLETLNFEYCKSLEEVQMSIGDLVRLSSLNLHGCVNLETLPDTICNLRTLRCLDIGGCSSLKALPIELGNFESLTELKACRLSVSKLPDSTGLLSKLSSLNLQDCVNLETLPDSICNLRMLRCLDIRGCSCLEALPIELGNFESLTELKAGGLSVSKSQKLSNLKQLEELHLSFCSGLTEIQGLEELTSIRRLYLEGCTSSQLAYNLTKRLFQIYSGLRHHIDIAAPEFPDWIGELSYDGSNMWSSKCRLNVSQNFLGMILCFQRPYYYAKKTIGYYDVENTTTGFRWRGTVILERYYTSLMVIVPRSVFPIKDGEEIELTSLYAARKCKIHLLYKSENDSATVDSEEERSNPDLGSNKNWLSLGSSSTTINVEEERSIPSPSDLESNKNWLSLGSSSTTINVEEEGSYPSICLKQSTRDNWLSL